MVMICLSISIDSLTSLLPLPVLISCCDQTTSTSFNRQLFFSARNRSSTSNAETDQPVAFSRRTDNFGKSSLATLLLNDLKPHWVSTTWPRRNNCLKVQKPQEVIWRMGEKFFLALPPEPKTTS